MYHLVAKERYRARDHIRSPLNRILLNIQYR